MVVMTDPLAKDSSHVFFAERDHEIQAFPVDSPDQPLTVGIGLRRPHRRTQDLQPECVQRSINLCRKHRVAVMNRKFEGVVAGDGLAELLKGPFRRRANESKRQMGRRRNKRAEIPVIDRGMPTVVIVV